MMEYDEARNQLEAFDSADNIATFLKGEGVQGSRGLADCCPVARWMQQETGKKVLVSVVSMWTDCNMAELTEERIHGESLAEFINLFDRNQYPELIENTPLYL